MILHVERIVVGEVRHRIVGKAITAKVLRVGVEHHLVRTRWHQETVIGIRACRREVEHEHEVATHEAEHLVAVVVPDFLNGRILEVLLRLDDFQHLSIEIT